MLLCRHQNAGQNHIIKEANRSFENVTQLKYLQTTAINENLMQQKINMRLNSGNACYHSVPKLLASPLLSINLNIKYNFAYGSVWVLTWCLGVLQSPLLFIMEERELYLIAEMSQQIIRLNY
jgi:hypothetical protein